VLELADFMSGIQLSVRVLQQLIATSSVATHLKGSGSAIGSAIYWF